VFGCVLAGRIAEPVANTCQFLVRVRQNGRVNIQSGCLSPNSKICGGFFVDDDVLPVRLWFAHCDTVKRILDVFEPTGLVEGPSRQATFLLGLSTPN
jgi:hypothetical protein